MALPLSDEDTPGISRVTKSKARCLLEGSGRMDIESGREPGKAMPVHGWDVLVLVSGSFRDEVVKSTRS